MKLRARRWRLGAIWAKNEADAWVLETGGDLGRRRKVASRARARARRWFFQFYSFNLEETFRFIFHEVT